MSKINKTNKFIGSLVLDERGVAVVRVLVARGEHNIAIVVDDILF